MGRYTGPVCKLCRREGEKLFLKGSRCMTTKCSFEKRGFAPGEHGHSRRFRVSDYGSQLREKQKIKRIYGVYEKQFRRYFQKADAAKGITGEILMQLLERRMENVVYRFGFAPSRRAARQLVRHRHFLVNDRIVNIPSFLVKEGDVIRVHDRSKKLELILEAMRRVKPSDGVAWLDLDKANMTGVFKEVPSREAIPTEVNEQVVVELYSK